MVGLEELIDEANGLSLLVGIVGSLFGVFCAWRMARRILALVAVDARLATVIRDSFDAIMVQDRQGRILSWNQGSERMYGYTEAEALGMNVRELVPDGIRQPEESLVERLYSRRDGRELFDAKRVARCGRAFDVSVTATLLSGRGVGQPTVATTERDISERVVAEERFQSLAHYDGLTGLPNRNLFQERLGRELNAAKRRGTKLGLMFLDLDRFKHVNDSLGHAAGDALLREVAARLLWSLRASDTVSRSEAVESEPLSRLGGDEFTILLSDISDPQNVAMVAQRLMDTLANPVVLEGQEVYPTTSIGITVFPLDGEDSETLMRNADSAMYHAKGGGGNRFAFFEASMNAEAKRKLAVSGRLHRALQRQELVLHYQPLRDANTGTLMGAEALLRWDDPVGGLIPPDEFIPIAENTGLILPIGEWVLRTACAQAQAWQDAGYRSIRMAVNVSTYQLRQPAWAQTVARILEETRLSPAMLELELTETAILANDDATCANLSSLHESGVGLSLDDFGTGYSSLSHLQHFPIGRLKIDRSFVAEIAPEEDAALAETILSMAKSLKLKVVAEGVETEYQAEFVRARGCHELQGYLFSPAVPAHEFHRFLEREKKE